MVGGKENSVKAGDGNDVILAFGQKNTIVAGDGNNIVLAGGESNSVLAGEGDDIIATFGVTNTVAAGDGDNLLLVGGEKNRITSGSGNDVLIAMGQMNIINAGGGDNFLFVGGEYNIVSAGDTVHTLASFAGDDLLGNSAITKLLDSVGGGLIKLSEAVNNLGDTVSGFITENLDDVLGDHVAKVAGEQTGEQVDGVLESAVDAAKQNAMVGAVGDAVSTAGDLLNVGEFGDNTVFAAGSGNVIMLGSGDDLVIAAGAGNIVATGDGDDVVVSLGSGNTVAAGAGNDIVLVAGEKNLVSAGAGDDIVVSLGEKSVISAGLGDDFVVAFGGGSVVTAGGGNDIVVVGGSGGIAMGGEGNDVLVGAGWGLVDVFGSQQAADVGTRMEDAFSAITSVFQNVGDSLAGGLSDAIAGIAKLSGVALLYGGEGNDTLIAGFGANILDGGAGADTYVYHFGDGATGIEGVGAGDVLKIMAGPMFPDLTLSQSDISATLGEGGIYTLSFAHGGESYGSITLHGFDANADSILKIVGGNGSSFDIDLDVLLGNAGSQAGPELPHAAMGDRMDLFSSLLTNTLVHDGGTPAPGGEDHGNAVHADLFANASEQALQQDAGQTPQQNPAG